MARLNKPADESQNPLKPARTAKRGNGSSAAHKDAAAVAKRAYEIYQNRGGSHGADLDDWLEAERQLGGAPGNVIGPVPPKPRRRKASEGPGL